MPELFNKEFISFVENMPAFPKSVQSIVQLTSDANASAKEIIQVIESDPIMTVKILKVINSAFYGLPNKISSIQRAVIHIGLNTIKNLALCVVAMGVLKTKNNSGFDTHSFLLHSLSTAIIAKLLATRLNVPSSENSDYFVAGLLHDFGKIVFAEYDPENFKLALQKSSAENIALDLAEIEFMGLSHADAGSLLARVWGLDERLVHAIDHHHTNINDKNILKDCVFTANQISKKLQFGFSGNPVIEELPENIVARFGLTLDQLIEDLGDLSHVKTEALLFINP